METTKKSEKDYHRQITIYLAKAMRDLTLGINLLRKIRYNIG
jgi:hypothetical protein